MLTGEVKKILAECLTNYVLDFQKKRAAITDEDVEHFMRVRTISPNPTAWKEELEKRAEEKKRKEDEKAK